MERRAGGLWRIVEESIFNKISYQVFHIDARWVRKIYYSRLVGNIFNLFFLQGFSYIYPILLIPFLTKTIGMEKYGLVYFAIAFAWYFQVICEFGFDLSNVRHVVNNKNDKKKLSEILSSITFLKLFFSLVLFVVYVILVFLLPSFREYYILYLISYFRVFANSLLPYWLFRSLENVKYIARITLVVKTILITPIFILVKGPEDYLVVIIFFVLIEIVSALVAYCFALKIYDLKIVRCSSRQLIYLTKDSVPFFTSNIITRLYTRSNMLVIGLVMGNHMAGIYSVSEKLYNVYANIVAPLIQHVFYPYFMRIRERIRMNKIVFILVFLNTIALSIMYFVFPMLLPFFVKDSLAEVSKYFPLFLLLLFIDVPIMLLGYPYLGTLNKIKYVNRAAINSSIFYFLGLIILLLINSISIPAMVYLLILTQLFCLLQLIYFVRLS